MYEYFINFYFCIYILTYIFVLTENCRFLQEAYNASGVSGDSLGRQFDTLNIAPERKLYDIHLVL